MNQSFPDNSIRFRGKFSHLNLLIFLIELKKIRKLNLDSEGDFMQLNSHWKLIPEILSERVALEYECNVSGWFS